MRELIVDSFAGGGGASTGIEMALGLSPDIAVNHDAVALAMHAVNHPQTLHRARSRACRTSTSRSISKTDQVRMCGNSVCPPLAAALVKANFMPRELEAESASSFRMEAAE